MQPTTIHIYIYITFKKANICKGIYELIIPLTQLRQRKPSNNYLNMIIGQYFAGGAHCVIKLLMMAASALSASMEDRSWESLSLRSSTSLCSLLMWLQVSCNTFEADTCDRYR